MIAAAARLVDARRLLKAVLLICDIHVLLKRYEGHHSRQMAEALQALDTLRRAKAAKSDHRSDCQDPTPVDAD